jgi:hypothetical protein
MTHDLFGLGLNLKRENFWFSFALSDKICHDKWSLLNSVLTSNGSNLRKTHHTKAVNDFNNFPVSIIMPSSHKWPRSNDLWKWGVLLKFQFSGQIDMNWHIRC